MTLLHPQSLLASKMMQYVSSGGNHYHPALLSPIRTSTEPWALLEQQKEAMTALGHTENEGVDREKHWLGVLKGKNRLGLETPQIVAWNHGTWSKHHIPNPPPT